MLPAGILVRLAPDPIKKLAVTLLPKLALSVAVTILAEITLAPLMLPPEPAVLIFV
jgi:hypothetical protein